MPRQQENRAVGGRHQIVRSRRMLFPANCRKIRHMLKPAQNSMRDFRHSGRRMLLRPEGSAQEVFPPTKRRAAVVYRHDNYRFRAGQTLFPRTSAWDKIRHVVCADFDDATWEHLRGAVSAPFAIGGQIAVKAIDERGNELMAVKRTTE